MAPLVRIEIQALQAQIESERHLRSIAESLKTIAEAVTFRADIAQAAADLEYRQSDFKER